MKIDDQLDIVVLYKKVMLDNEKYNTCFIPYKVIEGYYVEEEELFYDLDGTAYMHLIYNPENIGFMDRTNYKKRVGSGNSLIKRLVFNKIMKEKKDTYYYYLDECQNSLYMPLLIYVDGKVAKVYNDTDINLFYLNYYYDNFSKLEEMGTIEVGLNSQSEEQVIDVELDNDSLVEPNKKINVADLYKQITDVIIDQDEPIKKILTAVWKQNNDFSNTSRNILLNGGTGVGKTAIFRILSKLIEVPCVITGATEYSATAYKGKDVEEMLISLVNKAKGNVSLAERGILIIDEVDKISETNKGEAQVNQRAVQENLLKILEDAVINIKTNYGTVDFDTSKLMVIAMGSWTMAKVNNEKSIGFNSKVEKKDYKKLTREDMVENGLIPDFVGRFNTIIQMNDLTYDSMIRILKQSKNSFIKINEQFFNSIGIKLTIEEDAYDSIAKKASNSKYGARELDHIIDEALSKASFEIASKPDKYSELIINKDTIEDNKKYKLVPKK